MANKVVISVMMAVHGRMELTLHAIYHIEELILEVTGSIPEVFCVCSTDDEFRKLSEAGVTVTKCPNNPVSEKHNTLLNLAMGGADWTHLLHLGSDNFITKLYLQKLIEQAKKGHELIGTPNLSVIRPNQQKAIHFNYKSQALKVLGAGRLFSRELLEKTMAYNHECTRVYYSFRKGDKVLMPKNVESRVPVKLESDEPIRYILWPYKADNGLDMQSMKLLSNFSNTTVLRFEIPQVLDVKINDDNITKWARLHNKDIEVDYLCEVLRFKIVKVLNEAN